MAFLNYEYKMKISYSKPVDKCYFTIKSIPANDFRQRDIAHEISVAPPAQYSQNSDSFGNIQIIGSESVPHSEFTFVIKGLVETNPASISCGIIASRIGMYKYPHGKCVPGPELKKYAEEIESEVNICGSDKEKCIKIMNLLQGKMSYEPGSTDINTSAEDAFCSGKGVCQDYSHILITLLRMFKIPARYVCGLIVGEGESHAWVEAACDGNFIAFDPTHDREVTDEYIKFGVGREAADCSINKGTMWGGGTQVQEVSVKVDKYY